MIPLAFSFQQTSRSYYFRALKINTFHNEHFIDSTGDDSVDYALANRKRRDMLLLTASSLSGLAIISPTSAQAVVGDAYQKKGLYVLNTKDNESASSLNSEAIRVFPKLSSEYALLRVLPVKNVIFRTIERNLESLSVL